MAEVITFSPSPSIFGFGALKKLPEALESRGYQRVLIFTDRQIVQSGILKKMLDLLKGIVQFEVFDSVPAEPRSSDMDEQKGRIGSGFDALLGLGGGSPMDFAKAMAIIMTHGGSLGDYLGEGTVPGPVIPVVCVPTTSGTGSQSTQTTVFTIGGVKQGTSSEYIRPVLSIVDPELTMGLPPEVTRNSGYDALMHACESFISRPHSEVPERKILYQGSNSFSRPLSLEAFRTIWSSYRRAVSDGKHRQAGTRLSGWGWPGRDRGSGRPRTPEGGATRQIVFGDRAVHVRAGRGLPVRLERRASGDRWRLAQGHGCPPEAVRQPCLRPAGVPDAEP